MTVVLWSESYDKRLSKLVDQVKSVSGGAFGHTPLTSDRYVPGPNEVVLAIGSQPFTLLQQSGIAVKNKGLSSQRNKLLVANDGSLVSRYLLTFDPFQIELDYGRKTDILWDLQLAARLDTTGSMEPKLGKYRWVSDFSELIDKIKAKYKETGKPVKVSYDTETMGLLPWYPGQKGIVALGFSCEEGTGDCLYLREKNPDPKLVLSQIEWLLNAPEVSLCGANLKYDLIWTFLHLHIKCTNFKLDTTIVGSLLDENRSNSLKIHAKVYTPIGGYSDRFDEETDKEHMEVVPKEKLLPYLGGDVDAGLRVANRLKDDLLAENGGRLARFYTRILHPAARVYEKIEMRGIQVDVGRFMKLKTDLETDIKTLNAKALSLLPYRLRAKYSDDLSLGRAGLLTDYFFTPLGLNLKPKMFTAKEQKPSTKKAHLQMFADVPEAKVMCDVLSELNSAEKVLSTYVIGFLKHLRPDGKFHPTFMLFAGAAFGEEEDDDNGTVTGRRSAFDPAIQTIPKRSKWAKRIRECLIAPPGKVFLGCDYSQGELKIIAVLANEANMLNAYLSGQDLHAVTGAKLGGMTLEELAALKTSDPDKYELIRIKAKAGNFGLIYGMGADPGYVNYAWASFGLKLTSEQAHADRNMFFDLYPRLLDYHQAQREFVHEHGYVVNPFGRVRHLPLINSVDKAVRAKAERQAINSPVQSCLGDMMAWSLAEIDREAPDLAQSVCEIHDAGYFLADEDKAEEAAKVVTTIMANLPIKSVFGWDSPLKFTADAEFGPDLGHMKKIKLAA